MPLAVLHSTVAAADIAAWASTRFPIQPVVSSRLLTRGFNDTYALESKDGARYALRLGARRGRRPADSDYEMAFLSHLAAAEVPVVRPIAAHDGRLWQPLALPERERPATLFRFLDGHAPAPTSVDDACAQAETLARVHLAGARLLDPPARFTIDLDYLVRRAMAAIVTLPTATGEARDYLERLAARLTREIEGRAAALTRVHCHGDCHGGNARIADGPAGPVATLFDFDDCGPGFLAYDLAVFLWGTRLMPDQHALWLGFIERYDRVNPIGAADFDAIRFFVPIRHIWLMGEYAIRADEWGTDWLGEAWIKRQVAFLRAFEDRELAPRLV